MIRIITILSAIILVSSCTYDNEEDYYGDTCDTLNVTFSQSIEPIIDVNCVSCHNSSFNNGGVLLDNYSDIKTLADNGLLLGVIEHKPGFKSMPPPPASMLDDCSIEKIKIWIKQGSQNN